jgi:hypothetical protein
MFCPHCGASNVGTSRFCMKCGQPLILPIVPVAPIATSEIKSPRGSRKRLLFVVILILVAAAAGVIWLLRGQTPSLVTSNPTETPVATQAGQTGAQLSPLMTPARQTTTMPTTVFNSPQATQTILVATPLVARVAARSAHIVYLPEVLKNACLSDPTPYGLTSGQLSRLGCPAQDFVANRRVIIQRFEHGVMVLFAKPSNVFDKQGGGFLYALAADGRAWKLKDIFVETTSDRRGWYDCDAQSTQGPEVTGVPWRGFGKVWCAYPDVKQALGKALSREETGISASFQSFELGRAFKLSDWRGFPGWKTSQIIVAYLSFNEGDYIPGVWEIK